MDMNFRDSKSHSGLADFYGVAWDRAWRWPKKKMDFSAIKADIKDRVEIKSCGFAKTIQEMRL